MAFSVLTSPQSILECFPLLKRNHGPFAVTAHPCPCPHRHDLLPQAISFFWASPEGGVDRFSLPRATSLFSDPEALIPSPPALSASASPLLPSQGRQMWVHCGGWLRPPGLGSRQPTAWLALPWDSGHKARLTTEKMLGIHTRRPALTPVPHPRGARVG